MKRLTLTTVAALLAIAVAGSAYANDSDADQSFATAAPDNTVTVPANTIRGIESNSIAIVATHSSKCIKFNSMASNFEVDHAGVTLVEPLLKVQAMPSGQVWRPVMDQAVQRGPLDPAYRTYNWAHQNQCLCFGAFSPKATEFDVVANPVVQTDGNAHSIGVNAAVTYMPVNNCQ